MVGREPVIQKPSTARCTPLFLVGLIALAVFVTFGYRLMFLGETLAPIDGSPWVDIGALQWVNWPTVRLLREALSRHQVPLWSDRLGIGAPLLADPHNATLSPFTWVLLLLPSTYGWDLMMLLRLTAIIILAFRFFGLVTDKPWCAAVGALLYGFSGHVLLFLHHFHLNTLAFVPLFLGGLCAGLEGRRAEALRAMAISTPLMIFGGGLLDAVLSGLLALLVFVCHCADAQARRAGGIARSFLRVSGLGLIGVALAAVFLFPYLDLRTVTLPAREGRSLGVFNDGWYGVGLLASRLCTTPRAASHAFMAHHQYLHLLVLPGLLFSLPLVPRVGAGRRYPLHAAWAFVLFYYAKLYGFLPVVDALPLLRDVRFIKYQGTLNLAIYLLVAAGYDQIVRRWRTGGRPRFAVVAAFVLSAGVPLLYAQHEQLARFRLVALYSAVPLAGLAALSIRRSRAPWAFLAVALAQLRLDAPDRLALRREPTALSPTVEAELTRIVSRDRVLPLVEPRPRVWAAQGFHDVRNISVVLTQRYHQFFWQVLAGQPDPPLPLLQISDPRLLSLPAAEFLGVGYVIVRSEQLRLLSEAHVAHAWPLATDPGLVVLELAHASPPLRVTDRSELTASGEAMGRLQRRLATFEHMPFAPALLEDPDGLLSDDPQDLRCDVKLVQRSDGEITALVESNKAVLVVLTSDYVPGWQTSIDGAPARLLRADVLFPAVRVPRGRHMVRFRYAPWSVVTGLATSLVTLLLVIGFAVWRRSSWRVTGACR